MVLTLGSTILRRHLDAVPLWRGDHVAVKQIVEDFARYLYLPRVAGPEVLVQAMRDGVALLTWQVETFAYAESYDEATARYRGLRGGQNVSLSTDSAGMLVKPDVARRQMDAEVPPVSPPEGTPAVAPGKPGEPGTATAPTKPAALPRRFHATVEIDPHRAGRDAGRIADEVLTHLVGLVGADAKVTIEIEVTFRDGVPEHVVRTVSENCQTLKFKSFGFEKE
jgi:hypothetical protein